MDEDTDAYHRFYGMVRRIEMRKYERERMQKIRRSVLTWEILEQEMDEFLLENYSDDLNLDIQNVSFAETAEAPSDLILPLLRYQKEWLAWSLKQETIFKGGILADEMGMGKTVEAIALVLAQRKLKKATSGFSILPSSPGTSQELPTVKGTLVVCPVIGATQWFHEIERCTTKGSNKTIVYHGPNREKCMYKLEDYDFVITTYSVIQADYWPKRSKQNSKNSKWSDDGSIENSAWVGEDVSTRKSILHSVKWERIILDEATIKTQHNGRTWNFIFNSSLITLFYFTWWTWTFCLYVALEQSRKCFAHNIKSIHSNTTQAVLALESFYKWALTGTPLQNRMGELYSFVRFLQVTPYACYFCEDCNCSGLDFSSYDVCSQCSHQPERHFLWWKNYIEKPLKAYENEGRDAMVWLKYKILKSLMLRRTKKERAVDLALPTKTVTVRKDSLDEREYDYYRTLHDRSRAQFEIYAQIGHLMNNFGQILGMITPLRQAANHPYLVMYSRKELASGNKEAGDVEQSCVLCQDAVEDPVVTCCRHVFCRACMIYLAEDVRETPCPSCTKPLTFNFSGNKDDSSSKPTVKGFRSSSILNKIQLDKFKTSTKIEALKEEISDMFERDGSAKGIVFSQFTSFLDLIQYSLNLCGINCVQLVGSMSIAARDAALKRFTVDSNCKILLMSLKAGGVALNLTVASHWSSKPKIESIE
ncbi:hypothetical protein KY290_031781 [Solanum tuberosum]|uniref:DEXH helicase-like repair protein n=1 Tax=Solanum tuberosum TaxID=4113 RepID=A0ABQ7UAB2_SOLTU|nr:hypothetical protein KY289_031178 [Solanum tuberosum]KAH0743788.1 hypothetical protein KY290_031781 [Solanum tuberosum]